MNFNILLVCFFLFALNLVDGYSLECNSKCQNEALVICMNGETTDCCRHTNVIKRPMNGFLTVTCSFCNNETKNKPIVRPKIKANIEADEIFNQSNSKIVATFFVKDEDMLDIYCYYDDTYVERYFKICSDFSTPTIKCESYTFNNDLVLGMSCSFVLNYTGCPKSYSRIDLVRQSLDGNYRAFNIINEPCFDCKLQNFCSIAHQCPIFLNVSEQYALKMYLDDGTYDYIDVPSYEKVFKSKPLSVKQVHSTSDSCTFSLIKKVPPSWFDSYIFPIKYSISSTQISFGETINVMNEEFTLSGLPPGSNTFTIEYRLSNNMWTEQLNFTCQTKALSENKDQGFIHSGGYIFQGDEILLFTTTSSNSLRNYEPIRVLKNVGLHNNSNSDYFVSCFSNDSYLQVNACFYDFHDERCKFLNQFVAYPNLIAPKQVAFVYWTHENYNGVYLRWNSDSDALFYAVFWCSSNIKHWNECSSKDFNWIQVPTDKNFINMKVQKDLPTKFAVSKCYQIRNETFCSPMIEAKPHDEFEASIKGVRMVQNASTEDLFISWLVSNNKHSNPFVYYYEISYGEEQNHLTVKLLTSLNHLNLTCRDFNYTDDVFVQIIPVSIMNFDEQRSYPGKTHLEYFEVNCSVWKNKNRPESPNQTESVTPTPSNNFMYATISLTCVIFILIIGFGFVIVYYKEKKNVTNDHQIRNQYSPRVIDDVFRDYVPRRRFDSASVINEAEDVPGRNNPLPNLQNPIAHQAIVEVLPHASVISIPSAISNETNE